MTLTLQLLVLVRHMVGHMQAVASCRQTDRADDGDCHAAVACGAEGDTSGVYHTCSGGGW